MSAYVVDRAHIDALVHVAIYGPADVGPAYPGDGWSFHAFYCSNGDGDLETFNVRPETADVLGRILWAENVRSVAYRYPQDGPNDRPGPIGFSDADVDAYTFDGRRARRLTLLETFVALEGFEYQACETADWTSTPAHAFCHTLRHYLIHRLPGYRDADTWSIYAE